MSMNLTAAQKAYLAGFLDGDGSIYVRLKPNKTYRYGYQVSPYIIFFQSKQNQKQFEKMCSVLGLGYIRERKDGILEYTINRKKEIQKFLKIVKPYSILKSKQVVLMEKIMEKKEKIKNKNDFSVLMNLVNSFGTLNYSKRRKTRVLTP